MRGRAPTHSSGVRTTWDRCVSTCLEKLPHRRRTCSARAAKSCRAEAGLSSTPCSQEDIQPLAWLQLPAAPARRQRLLANAEAQEKAPWERGRALSVNSSAWDNAQARHESCRRPEQPPQPPYNCVWRCSAPSPLTRTDPTAGSSGGMSLQTSARPCHVTCTASLLLPAGAPSSCLKGPLPRDAGAARGGRRSLLSFGMRTVG